MYKKINKLFYGAMLCLKSSFFLKMKLTFIILFCTFLNVAASSYGQNVTLSVKNVPFEQFLDQLSKQTKYHFLYDYKLLSEARPVSIKVSDLPLHQVLQQGFANQPFSYVIRENNVIITAKSPQKINKSQSKADITVSGTVKDAQAQPLAGVSVMVKGTRKGVVSDNEGKYSLAGVDENAVIVFSFIGYKSLEVPVNGRTSLNASLEEEGGNLNEVLVVGYGTQSKSTVSNAITKVTAEEISRSPSANLGAGLAGRISGVTINARGGEPGSEAVEVFIRGKSTTGDSNPLYVIDGIVRDYSGFSYLNPNEIESISVLKDASAAIYGSRAANGVILVTTKRGTEGKPSITLDYDYSLSQQMRIPETADAFTFASMANLQQRIKGQPQPYSATDLELYQNGQDPLFHPNTNWGDLMFKNFSNQHRVDLAVRGGGKDSRYFVSAGYLNANSPYVDGFTYNKQYSVRSNLDFNVTPDLKVSIDLSGRKRDLETTKTDFAHIYLGVPLRNAIYPNGLIGPGRDGNNSLLMVRDRNYGYNNTQASTFFGTVGADYQMPFLKGLSLQGNFAYDFDDAYNKSWAGITYYYQLNPTTGEYERKQNTATVTPNLSVSNPKSNAITSNIRLGYKRTIAEDHGIDAFIGYEQNTTQGYLLTAGRNAFASGALEELFAGTADKLLQSNSGSSSQTGRDNYFGRAQYTYKNRYNVQFQFRYDGSQNFPVGQRYGFFPGVSGNWNISNEDFMKNVKVIDYLKVRASYGELGNDKVGAFQYLTSYGYGANYVFNGTSYQGLVQSGAPNPNITWEVAKTTDIGLEFGLAKGLLNGEIDLFRTYRSNILARRNASVPNYTGLVLPNENIGRVENKGIEISLTHSYAISDKFKYSVSGNFTYAKNTILFQDETPGIPEWQRGEGKPLGSPVLYEAIGVFNDAAEVASSAKRDGAGPGDLIIRDVNGDGIINSLDAVRQNYGVTPEIVYGLNFRFTYSAFELFLGFQGQAHAMGQRFNPYPYDPIGWGNFPTYLSQDVWTPENPNGSKPKPGMTNAMQSAGTTYNWENASFLKLKTAELSYNLPASWLRKSKIQRARIYASGSNLFFVKDHFKYVNLDPELTNAGWGYSQNRLINFGASITF